MSDEIRDACRDDVGNGSTKTFAVGVCRLEQTKTLKGLPRGGGFCVGNRSPRGESEKEGKGRKGSETVGEICRGEREMRGKRISTQARDD